MNRYIWFEGNLDSDLSNTIIWSEIMAKKAAPKNAMDYAEHDNTYEIFIKPCSHIIWNLAEFSDSMILVMTFNLSKLQNTFDNQNSVLKISRHYPKYQPVTGILNSLEIAVKVSFESVEKP